MESDLVADPAMRQRQHFHCHLVLAGECGRDGVGGVMSREAMKLAWEAEEKANPQTRYNSWCRGYEAALREALAKPDFWEGYEPEPVKSATTETNGGKTGWPPGLLQDDCKGLSKWLSNKPDAKRRVREALDKKAENARELGLDYEPARDSGIVTAGGADPRTQRKWVGLTPEETLEEAHKEEQVSGFIHGASWASFKLRERNT